jgi:hypothetical protein
MNNNSQKTQLTFEQFDAIITEKGYDYYLDCQKVKELYNKCIIIDNSGNIANRGSITTKLKHKVYDAKRLAEARARKQLANSGGIVC